MTFQIKTTDEILNEIKINLIENVDGINDANIGSVMDVLVTSLSQELSSLYQSILEVYNASRVDTATGEDLEQIGALVTVDRNLGSKSTSTLTFIRDSPTQSNFTISSGLSASTEPGTELEQLFFTTTESKTFPTSISDFETEFKEGVYHYALSERFIDSITEILQSGSTISSNTYSLVEDYSKPVVDTSSLTLIDNLSSLTDWTSSLDAATPSENTGEFYIDSQSLNIAKPTTSTNTLQYSANFSSNYDLTGTSFIFNLYIKDNATKDKLQTINCSYGSDTSNKYERQLNISNLDLGWNTIVIDRASPNVDIIGNVNDSLIDYFELYIETKLSSDTLSDGDILLDNCISAEYDDTLRDVVLFDKSQTLPSDNTISIDFVPLSVDIPAESEEVGTQYNTQKNKVVFLPQATANISRVSNYSAFTGGINVESDNDYRERIKNAKNIQNVATDIALQQNLLSLQFLNSVTVTSTPQETAAEEVITYSSSIDKYKLLNQFPIDSSITIGDTSGADDYTLNTDFILTTNGEIDWSIGGSAPTDGNDIYVNYDYNRIGFVDIVVAGSTGTLTSQQLTEVNNTVDSVKAAGITVNIDEPSFVTVNIEATIEYVDSNISSTTDEEINTAIENYIQSRGIGKDIYLAGIIQTVMVLSNVKNISAVTINGASSDLSIASNESTTLGTITLN